MRTAERIVLFIDEYNRQNNYSPSVRQIADGVGLQSTSTVHGHLIRLEQKGIIKKVPHSPRTWTLIGNYEKTLIRSGEMYKKIKVISKIQGVPVRIEIDGLQYTLDTSDIRKDENNEA